jgi:hypothetical protein
MAIRRPNLAARTFDIFLLCLLRDRSSFVRDVVLELSQRGYTVFLPKLCEVDSDQRATSLCHGVSRARLSAAIVGPAFLRTAWTTPEVNALEQVEVHVRSVASADRGATDVPAVMVFDACGGVTFIASKLARACGHPGGIESSPSSTPTICWRCGTADLSRGSRALRWCECAGCADHAWRDPDPESPYDPDPLSMGLVPSIGCLGCGTRMAPHITYRNRDVTDPGGAMKIRGVACACGCDQFAVTWSGGSSYEEDW